MATTGNRSTLGSAMSDADYVLVDGVVFVTEYLRLPDGDTVPDDILLEARSGATEIAFTQRELDDAEDVGEGVYRLKSGEHIRFLSNATVH